VGLNHLSLTSAFKYHTKAPPPLFNCAQTVPTTPPTILLGNGFQDYIWLVTLDSSLAAQKAQQYGTRGGNPCT
jgi:hypothetical protein